MNRRYLLVAALVLFTATADAQTKKDTVKRHPVLHTKAAPEGTEVTMPGEQAPPPPIPRDEQVFNFVEQMPEFNGDLNKYIAEHMHYPDDARDSGIMGRVIVQFVVEKNGSVSHAKVVRGISPPCDKEALRVVENMPPWKPGRQGGKPLKTYYTVPLNFSLK